MAFDISSTLLPADHGEIQTTRFSIESSIFDLPRITQLLASLGRNLMMPLLLASGSVAAMEAQLIFGRGGAFDDGFVSDFGLRCGSCPRLIKHLSSFQGATILYTALSVLNMSLANALAASPSPC